LQIVENSAVIGATAVIVEAFASVEVVKVVGIFVDVELAADVGVALMVVVVAVAVVAAAFDIIDILMNYYSSQLL